MKVYIGVGHGGTDAGATKNELIEKNMNLVTAFEMKSYLESRGVDVKISRVSDVYKSVSDKVKECNAYQPDVCFDVHYNAGGGLGFECYCNSANTEMKKLSSDICALMVVAGHKNRGVKDGMKYQFVRTTEPDCILLEGGFIDNADNAKMIDTTAEQKAIGIIYAKAVLKHYGIKDVSLYEQVKQKLYTVQTGAFASKDNADKYASELKSKGYDTYVKEK